MLKIVIIGRNWDKDGIEQFNLIMGLVQIIHYMLVDGLEST